MQLELLLVALVLAFGPLISSFQRSAFSTFVDLRLEGMGQMADTSILLYNCIFVFISYTFSGKGMTKLKDHRG